MSKETLEAGLQLLRKDTTESSGSLDSQIQAMYVCMHLYMCMHDHAVHVWCWEAKMDKIKRLQAAVVQANGPPSPAPTAYSGTAVPGFLVNHAHVHAKHMFCSHICINLCMHAGQHYVARDEGEYVAGQPPAEVIFLVRTFMIFLFHHA